MNRGFGSPVGRVDQHQPPVGVVITRHLHDETEKPNRKIIGISGLATSEAQAGAGPDRNRAIVAEIYGSGAHFVVADATGLRLNTVWNVTSAEQPTFTGALQAFASRTKTSSARCALAVCAAGAVRPDVIRITNGSWFVSRTGLSAVTGGEVLLLNDVAAMAWATADAPKHSCKPIGAYLAPSGGRPQVILWAGSGVGAAALVRAGNRVVRVIDTEAGHVSFAAATPEEWAVSEQLRRMQGHCSAERMIGLSDSPSTRIELPAGTECKDLQLAALASLAGDLVLAYAAWDGVFLAGKTAERLLDGGRAAKFRGRFAEKGRIRKLLDATPIWLLSERYLALRGAFAALRAQ